MENVGTGSTVTAGTPAVFDEIQDAVKGYGLDIEILVDVSGSMKQGRRLSQALEFAKMAAKVGALVDEDGGIGLTFFSEYPSDQTWEDVKESEIDAKFANVSPGGGTDTLKFIESEVKQHYERKAGKADQRTLIVCVTDGEPNGGTGEMKQIKARLSELQSAVDWTQKVPELKVLFYQVGDDAGAKKFIQDLDDDNNACGLIVEAAYEGKDTRSVAEIFRDAIREHLNP